VFRELLRRCAALTVTTLTDAQAAQLEAHYELLCRWNKVLNLTRVELLEEAVERHYCESLFLADAIPDVPCLRIADIGSGPGFPGFPVAVVRPECAVTLIESHQRKAVFLREASRTLPNVRVVASRAEDLTEEFDWVISRAVSYDDLGKALSWLGRSGRLALLTGEAFPPHTWGLDWEVLSLPWGRNRYLRVSRETPRSVPRETGSQ
jgi:16S rRNA (guanine(527)-N(7))-methyltransferase RsmG